MGPLTRSRLEELGVCGGFKYFRIGEMIQFALCIFLRWVGEKPPTRLYMFFFVVGFHTLGIIPYMLFAFLVRWLGINVHPRNLTHWYQNWWALELGTCAFAFEHGYVQGINSLDFRVCNPREEWKKPLVPGTSVLPTLWGWWRLWMRRLFLWFPEGCTWNMSCWFELPGTPSVLFFLGNFTPKTSNFWLKNRALGFPGGSIFGIQKLMLQKSGDQHLGCYQPYFVKVQLWGLGKELPEENLALEVVSKSLNPGAIRQQFFAEKTRWTRWTLVDDVIIPGNTSTFGRWSNGS